MGQAKKQATLDVAYKEGYQAHQDGLEIDDCPHPKGQRERLNWMTGYLEARTQSVLGHVFEKYSTTGKDK